jgi:putative phosphoribosyl transferase
MWYEPKFKDRTEAGRVLAGELGRYADCNDVIVLALPRGGVPVGFEVAKELRIPLEVFVVRKLGVPGQEELAFGAIASGGVRVLNEDLTRALRIPEEMIEKIIERERRELDRREQLYRGGRPFRDVRGQTVIVVDDGLATGATMRAAVLALQKQEPAEIVVAVPVASQQACDEFKQEADVWAVCAVTPEPFYGVGMWYEDFSQTTDGEVQSLLESAPNLSSAAASSTGKTDDLHAGWQI